MCGNDPSYLRRGCPVYLLTQTGEQSEGHAKQYANFVMQFCGKGPADAHNYQHEAGKMSLFS